MKGNVIIRQRHLTNKTLVEKAFFILIRVTGGGVFITIIFLLTF